MKNKLLLFLIVLFTVKLNASDCKDNFDKLNMDELRQYFLKLEVEDKNFAAKVALYLIIKKYFSNDAAIKFYKENVENIKSKKEQIYKEIDKKFSEIFSFRTNSIERMGLKIDTRDFDACHSFYEFCYNKLNGDAKKELWSPEHVGMEFKRIIQSMLYSCGSE